MEIIEKNIPIPPKFISANLRKSVFHLMNVGDSVLLPKPRNCYGQILSMKFRVEGWVFTCRKQDDGQYRYWRVK
jgi:hypothetical protein